MPRTVTEWVLAGALVLAAVPVVAGARLLHVWGHRRIDVLFGSSKAQARRRWPYNPLGRRS